MDKSFDELSRWGVNTHSFLSLYADVQHFRIEGVEGYIPFVETVKMILVAGEPITSDHEFAELVSGLMKVSIKRKKTLGMIPAQGKIKPELEKLGFDSVFIGKEPIFNLNQLPRFSKSMRNAVRRIERRGVRVVGYDERFRGQIQLLSRSWQNTREMPAMQFLFQLRPLALKEHKQFFLAIDQNDQLLGFLACSPILGRNGWYLEDLVRAEWSPNGTSELLLIKAIESLAAQGYDLATLAIAPLAGLPDRDENHPWLNMLLRLSYKYLSWIYHFQTLEFFKSKFKPSYWEPNYFYIYPAGVDLVLVKNLMEAFLGTSIFSIVTHKAKKLLPKQQPDVA